MTKRNDIEQLFKTHFRRMHLTAVALLHDDDLARDIVHDVFIRFTSGMRLSEIAAANESRLTATQSPKEAV